MKQLIIYPVGGLGNRMQSIFSGIRKCTQNKYSSMIVIWTGADCCIDLEEIVIFNNVKVKIERIDHPHENAKYRMPNISSVGYGWKIEEERDLVTSCTFLDNNDVAWSYQHINKYIEWIQYPTTTNVQIGVHCRRSDWGLYYTQYETIKQQQTIIDENFIDYILPLVENKYFFLATDSITTLDTFKRIFGSRAITYSKSEYPTDCVRNKQTMIESLFDLHSLAKCNTIIRDSDSSYSLLSHIIGQNKIITYERPILKAAGPGAWTCQQIPLL